MLYAADDYFDQLKQRYDHDHEIASLIASSPDAEHTDHKGKAGEDKMTSVQVTDEKRSETTGRLWPESNKPDPMPPHLAFMFTRISPEQMMYMWNVYTAIFFGQCSCVVAYMLLLKFGCPWWPATLIMGIPAWQLCIQNVYCLHDVLHGATFPPFWWQKYITHCWSDQVSFPWEDIIMEHNKHHASTVDLLIHGEFGWDPSNWLYWPNEYSWFTTPLVLPWHFFGANDTGFLFACLWYLNFPADGPGGKCNPEFWKKWFDRRAKHQLWLCILWGSVWLLGTWPLGRSLSEGWRFFLPVTIAMRLGFTSAWLFIVNFNHSATWNHFLSSDPDRSWPLLHEMMALILGGRHRWNEILFHDLHHAFPNAVGTLSQRGRFHGWKKVHDAAVDILHNGLFKPNSDKPTQMQEMQKKRSVLVKQRISQVVKH